MRGHRRPRNILPLHLTRKLGIEDLLEPPNVMGLKSSSPQLKRPQYYAFSFSFACHVILEHLRPDDLVFSVQ